MNLQLVVAETRSCGRATLEPEPEPPPQQAAPVQSQSITFLQLWDVTLSRSTRYRTFWRFSSSSYVKSGQNQQRGGRTCQDSADGIIWAKLSSVPSLHSSRSSWSLTELRCSPSPPLHQIFYTVSIGTASSCSALMCVWPLPSFQVVESSTNIRMGKICMMNEVTVSPSGSLYTCSSGQMTENISTMLRNSALLKAETSDGAQCKGRDWPLNLMPHVWAGSRLGVALPVTDVFRVCRNWKRSSAEKCFPDVPDRFSQEVDFKATSWPQRTRPSLIFMF